MKKILLILTIACMGISQLYAYDVVVAKDGSGDYTTLQEAILSIRDYVPERKTIFVKNGIYKEKVVIPANKCNISIVGESMDETIITYNDHAKINDMGTFRSYSFKVEGDNITLYNLTIENNAPMVAQAVALHLEGTKIALINCKLLGNQDTIFTGSGSALNYFKNCYIEGTTDFIFGPATAWFEDCEIYSKKNSYITAASTPEESPYGYVFYHCKLTHNDDVTKVYLGRPWRAYASVLFIDCEMGDHIRKEGWHNWGKESNEATARYMEYNNSGVGADTSGRVKWSKTLTKKEAKAFRLKKVLDSWDIDAVLKSLS